MKTLPSNVYRQDISAQISHLTIPRQMLAGQMLPPNVWMQVVLLQGEVDLVLDDSEHARLTPGKTGVVAPQQRFRLAATGQSALFCLEYFHEAKQLDANRLAQALRHSA